MDDLDDPVGWPVRIRPLGGQQRPVDAVPGHQLGGFGGQTLGTRNALGSAFANSLRTRSMSALSLVM
jgi:hypothetical protein